MGTVSFVNHAIDLLLYAFAAASVKRDDLALLIVGGGKDLARAQVLAEELGIAPLCRFTGRVNGGDVPALLRLATVSVDPARNTPTEAARWPLKIVESLAAGVPVLTGDVGDRREMLGDGQAGLLVTPDDTDALTQGLLTMLNAPQRLAAMAVAARLLATRYESIRIAKQLLDFYSDGPLTQSSVQL